jgi:ADP-ribose pyrophosphatase
VDFWADTVRMPGGNLAVREYIGHPGAVAVIARLDRGSDPRLLFVRQYRYPVKEVTHEIPAGKLARGEDPRRCVRRELEEETGYRARRVKKLLSYWPTPAFADEVIHIFEASGLYKGRFHPDEDEVIEPVALRLGEALSLIRRGRVRDSKTVVGLLAYARWRRP